MIFSIVACFKVMNCNDKCENYSYVEKSNYIFKYTESVKLGAKIIGLHDNLAKCKLNCCEDPKCTVISNSYKVFIQ